MFDIPCSGSTATSGMSSFRTPSLRRVYRAERRACLCLPRIRLFQGIFLHPPYYEKVTEYNNIDHRDIWEYDLNFSEHEVLRMVMHMWELKDIYSDYYFFDENCSYDLLYLLEAARPSLELTDEFRNGLKILGDTHGHGTGDQGKRHCYEDQLPSFPGHAHPLSCFSNGERLPGCCGGCR